MSQSFPSVVSDDAIQAIPRDMTSVAEIMDWNNLMETYAAGNATPMPPAMAIDSQEAARYVDLYNAFMAATLADEYDYVHYVRFRSTVTVFGKYLEAAGKIVELGGDSRIGVFSAHALGADYRSYGAELRDRFALPDAGFDCVLCLEVIEHLKDTLASETTIERIASFNYSGVMNLLSESYRILAPGGVMLISTPNAISVDVIAKVMRGEYPHHFDPHVREMAPRQVKAFGERVGFVLEEYGTFFAWTSSDDAERAAILEFISQQGHDASNRGDDAFYVFRKPL